MKDRNGNTIGPSWSLMIIILVWIVTGVVIGNVVSHFLLGL